MTTTITRRAGRVGLILLVLGALLATLNTGVSDAALLEGRRPRQAAGT